MSDSPSTSQPSPEEMKGYSSYFSCAEVAAASGAVEGTPLFSALERAEQSRRDKYDAGVKYQAVKNEAIHQARVVGEAQLDYEKNPSVFNAKALSDAQGIQFEVDDRVKGAGIAWESALSAHAAALNDKDNAERAAAEAEREKLVAPPPLTQHNDRPEQSLRSTDGGRWAGPDHVIDRVRNTAKLRPEHIGNQEANDDQDS